MRQRRIRYGARRGTFLLLVLAAVAALAGVDLLGLFGRGAAWMTSRRSTARNSRVAGVVDGDTIDVACPQGPGGKVRIRLWGVDTPETVKPDTPVQHFGPEASAFVHQLLRGKTVKLQLEAQETRDKYGRLLAYVILDDGADAQPHSRGRGAMPTPTRDTTTAASRNSCIFSGRQCGRGLGLWANETEGDLPYYWRWAAQTAQAGWGAVRGWYRPYNEMAAIDPVEMDDGHFTSGTHLYRVGGRLGSADGRMRAGGGTPSGGNCTGWNEPEAGKYGRDEDGAGIVDQVVGVW